MPNIHLLRVINELPHGGLFHNDHDDSRYVYTGDNLIIKFTSNLEVYKDKVLVGHITSSVKHDDCYILEYCQTSEVYNTEVKCRNWHWKALEDAEIKIALHLLDIKTP